MNPRVSQVALVLKNPRANTGDKREVGSVSELGRAPGGVRGNRLLHPPFLEKPMDRGAWRATVDGVAQSQTQLKRLSKHTSCI